MPNALAASRDFARQAIARVRSGVEKYQAGLNQEGPDIKVDPFGPGPVSTPAALVKAGTSIAAGIRGRANWQAAQVKSKLEEEKTRAEIARLRAEGAYYEGTGRQTRAPIPTLARPIGTGPSQIPAGTSIAEANVGLRNRGLELQAQRDATHAASQKRYTAAQADLSAMDHDRDTQIAAGEALLRRRVNDLYIGAKNGDEASIAGLGFDPRSNDPGATEQHQQALKGLFDAFRARKRAEYEAMAAPKRQALRNVIDREALNMHFTSQPVETQPAEGDQGAGAVAAPDESDPLGILSPSGP